MKAHTLFNKALLALAGIGMLIPNTPARAGEIAGAPSATPPRVAAARSNVLDVRLGQNQSLSGQLLTPGGAGIVGAGISLSQGGKVVAQGITAQQGVYRFEQVSSGVYELATPYSRQIVRVWDAAVAPPAALQTANVIVREDVVRAQSYCDDVDCDDYSYGSGRKGMNKNALLAVGAIAVAGLAVGIVALADDDDDDNRVVQPMSP